jgi:hypothetical protein
MLLLVLLHAVIYQSDLGMVKEIEYVISFCHPVALLSTLMNRVISTPKSWIPFVCCSRRSFDNPKGLEQERTSVEFLSLVSNRVCEPTLVSYTVRRIDSVCKWRRGCLSPVDLCVIDRMGATRLRFSDMLSHPFGWFMILFAFAVYSDTSPRVHQAYQCLRVPPVAWMLILIYIGSTDKIPASSDIHTLRLDLYRVGMIPG